MFNLFDSSNLLYSQTAESFFDFYKNEQNRESACDYKQFLIELVINIRRLEKFNLKFDDLDDQVKLYLLKISEDIFDIPEDCFLEINTLLSKIDLFLNSNPENYLSKSYLANPKEEYVDKVSSLTPSEIDIQFLRGELKV